MSEYKLKTVLTADSASFDTAISKAALKLKDLASEEQKVKQNIAGTEAKLKEQTSKLGKNSQEVKQLKSELKELKARERELAAEVQKTTNEVTENTKSFSKNSNSVQGIFKMLKGLAVGYAGKTLWQALIGSNAEYEQTLTSFEVLLQSAEKADKMMDELTDFAATTPLQLDDTTKAATLLLNYGLAEEEVMVRMQQLGDLAMGNAEKLDRVALAYGQMLAKGKVSGEELRQMTEAGVPLQQALADAIGITTAELSKMIEKGEVGIPELNKAIEQLTGEGGRFFGMMEKQSQTFSGMLSTLKDEIGIFAREMGEEAFAEVKSALTGIMDEMDRMREDGTLQKLGQEIGSAIAFAVKALSGLLSILWDMRKALLAAGVAWATFKLSMSIIDLATGVWRAIRLLTGGLTAQAVAAKAATVATKGLNAALAANPIGAVISIIASLIATLITLYVTTDDAAESQESLTDSYRESIKALDDTKTAGMAEVQMLRDLGQRFDELNGKVEGDVQARNELASVVEKINAIIPDSITLIDAETGAYRLQKGAIEELAKAKEKEIQKNYEKSVAEEAYARIDELRNSKWGHLFSGDTSDYAKNTVELRRKEIAQRAAEIGLTSQDLKYVQMESNDMDLLTKGNRVANELAEAIWGTSYVKVVEDLRKQSEELAEIDDLINLFDSAKADYERYLTSDYSIAEPGDPDGAQKALEQKLSDDEVFYEEEKKYLNHYKNLNRISDASYVERLKSLREFYSEYLETDQDALMRLDEEIFNQEEKLFKNRIKLAQDSINKELEAFKSKYEAQKKAVNDYYDAIEAREKELERAESREELERLRAMYQNSVSLEGQKKLKEIEDDIKELNKEEERIKRQLEQEKVLSELDDAWDTFETKQKRVLDELNEYASNFSYAVQSQLATNARTNPNSTMGQIYNRYFTQTVNNTVTDSVAANILNAYLNNIAIKFMK